MRRRTLTVIALACLLSFALLAAYLAHGHGQYGFEGAVLRSLGSSSSIGTWGDVADLLATPAIVAVLVIASIFALVRRRRRRSVVRVAVYAGFAAAVFLISEHVAKPLVHETYKGNLTFPSGNVTAVCATAVAMWWALSPLLGRWARGVTLLLGAAWVLLMSAAVVGARWHTPFDALGSVLLSVGLIAAGAVLYEGTVSMAMARARNRSNQDEGSTSRLATTGDPQRRTSEAGRSERPLLLEASLGERASR